MKPGNLFCTALLMFAGLNTLQAQQKNCDMGITLMSPAAGAVINAYASFNITVRIVNNGPQDLVVGDTVWYNFPSMPLTSYRPFSLQEAIPSGGNSTVILTTSSNVTSNPEDVTEDYCVTVISRPDNAGSFVDTTITTNNNSCNSVTFKALPTSGIEEVNAGSGHLVLYPNPASNSIDIAWAGAAKDKPAISVFDLSGRRLIAKAPGEAVSGKEKLSLDISVLHPGMYLVELQSGKTRTTGRFIKQ
ncbi:T9SS type A sorting domain-containing protein [Taibaiella helva]|uniref:T9SS type A sorting domain-containing protein n=1 Tax=Taibaiella helva TaxID=2301235 RepID=UPI0013008D94|nr:T9SS type A sorting domain-containing protein [Taibaiella helva]